MLPLIILSVFILIIILIIIVEYKNEKKYQAKKHTRTQKKTPTLKKRKVKKAAPAPAPTPEPIPKVEVTKETKELPKADYPSFTHVRLVEMGLSEEEAQEFVAELIPQIESQIPLIEKAIKDLDFHQIERLTHGIKGSASNIGTGGVADLLADYNTYIKTGTDSDIAQAYLEHLIRYTAELKAQYT